MSSRVMPFRGSLTSRDQVAVYEFSWPAIIFIPLVAVLIQIFILGKIPFLAAISLPFMVTIFFAVARRNPIRILNEIREANLSYLMLAQSLIRTDRDQALYRLGISEESASLIALLTPAQMMKIAAGNTLLCRFRMDDDMVWGLLTNHGKSAANDSTNRLHASILMAGRHQEAA